MGRIIFGLILVLLGFSAILGISLFKFIFAIILVAIGIKVLSGGDYEWHGGEPVTSLEDFVNEVAIFSPVNKVIRSDNFKGGKIVFVFSGGVIDLSQAKTTAPEVELEFTAVLGGGKLIVPAEWNVSSRGAGVFGGYSTRTNRGTGGTTLRIKGAAVFGGIEVTN